MGEILVVYDTTVLRGRKHDLDHPTLAAIRDLKGELGYRLAIPEVVVQESIRQEMQLLQNRRKEVDSFLQEIGARVGKDLVALRDSDGINRAVAEFPKHFRARIAKEHDEILPLPRVRTEVLLRRELADKRPFGRGQGKGLRDFLIWLSILEAKQKYDSRIIFISANTKDFAVDGKLAPEYIEDLREIGESEDGVMLVPEPDEFLNQWLKPSNEETKSVAGAQLSAAYGETAGKAATSLLRTTLRRTSGDELLGRVKNPAQIEDVWFAQDFNPNLTWHVRPHRGQSPVQARRRPHPPAP